MLRFNECKSNAAIKFFVCFKINRFNTAIHLKVDHIICKLFLTLQEILTLSEDPLSGF